MTSRSTSKACIIQHSECRLLIFVCIKLVVEKQSLEKETLPQRHGQNDIVGAVLL
jgi:hypothetical protein